MATWGETSPSYRLPLVRLLVPGAAWLADAAVSSWSVDRELVGSTIPGNIRSANGLSIGAASVSVVNAGEQVTPWSPKPNRVVSTDGTTAARLVAQADDGDQLPLGSWVIAPTSGSLTSRGVDLDLLEAQYVGRGLAQALEPYGTGLLVPFVENAPVDPCWTVGRLAAQAGFDPVPPPVASTLLAMPLHGGFAAVPTPRYPISPFRPDGSTEGQWEVLAGDVAVGPAGGRTSVSVVGNGNEIAALPSDVLVAGGSLFFTLNAVEQVWLMDLAQGWLVRIVNDPDASTFTLSATNDGSAPGIGVTFAGQQSAAWPTRVQVEMQRDWNAATSQWTELRVRIRSTGAGSWSSWLTHSTPTTPLAERFEIFTVSAEVEIGSIVAPGPGSFAALQVTTEADSALWAPSKAHLKPLGGDVGIPWVPADLDVWAAIQACCSAWLGAAIMGTDGVLRMLDKDDLAGVNSSGTATDIGRDWTDLPWTIDPADTVDRVAVTVAEPTVRVTDVGAPILAAEAWRAPDVISVPAGATVKIPVTFENRAAIGVFSNFSFKGSTPEPLWSTTSFVNVNTKADGTGTAVSAASVAIQVQQTSATTAEVTYRNRAAATQYLVTATGEPSLIINAQVVASYETPQVIERGLPAGQASQVLEVDLTPWVQRTEDAAAIADYLWSRLSGTGLWKASSVRVRLDWSHELGKVLLLQHPTTGLEAKALITKVHYEGSAGEVAQTLDLVLLPWTYADFAAAWDAEDPAATYADFAAAQGPTRTYADMAADRAWTGVA